MSERDERDDDAPDTWDRASAWLAARGALYALGLLTIYMIWIYGHVFTGEVAGDDNTFHFAESARLIDCLRAGDWDFWNPSANAGYATAYYYQVIPQLASALPAAIFGHHLFWFELSVFLPHVLAPAAAYRGARLLGATPWQSVVGATLVVFVNSDSRWSGGNAGTFMVGLYTQTWALCAFPLAVGHAARWVNLAERAERPRHLALAIAWGAFTGLCHPFIFVALGVALVAVFAWQLVLAALGRAEVGGPLVRSFVLGVLLFGAMAPVWLPLVVDYVGFGGFPHRVKDEIGPGFGDLGRWFVNGRMFDWDNVDKTHNPRVFTLLLPLALFAARGSIARWVWPPVIAYAIAMGLGPHLGKTQDDLFPMVRFYGALQVLAAIGVGASLFAIGRALSEAPEGSRWHWILRGPLVAGARLVKRDAWARAVPLQYAMRTAVAAALAAGLVILIQPATVSLRARVVTLPDQAYRNSGELVQAIAQLRVLPPGRKQALQGAESSFWNLLPYVYARRPALLQMGGGGLQASPNYTFILSANDVAKTAWLFDAPYIVFAKANVDKMPVGETVLALPNYEIRALPAPGLVSPVQVTGVLPPGRHEARKAALAWLQTGLPFADEFLAYIEPAVPGAAAVPGPAPQGQVLRFGRTDAGGDDADIFAEVTATAPTTFVIRESWHPRWRAYLDGREVPVRRLTPDFPAVDVPAGAHLLQLRFERPWWATWCWLAWPLLALLGYAGARAFRV